MNTKDLSQTEKFKTVLNLIKKERARRGISECDLSIKGRQEASCFAFGEGRNLVEFQLIPSNEKYNESWKTIKKDTEILDLAYNYLMFNKKGF